MKFSFAIATIAVVSALNEKAWTVKMQNSEYSKKSYAEWMEKCPDFDMSKMPALFKKCWTDTKLADAFKACTDDKCGMATSDASNACFYANC